MCVIVLGILAYVHILNWHEKDEFYDWRVSYRATMSPNNGHQFEESDNFGLGVFNCICNLF